MHNLGEMPGVITVWPGMTSCPPGGAGREDFCSGGFIPSVLMRCMSVPCKGHGKPSCLFCSSAARRRKYGVNWRKPAGRKTGRPCRPGAEKSAGIGRRPPPGAPCWFVQSRTVFGCLSLKPIRKDWASSGASGKACYKSTAKPKTRYWWSGTGMPAGACWNCSWICRRREGLSMTMPDCPFWRGACPGASRSGLSTGSHNITMSDTSGIDLFCTGRVIKNPSIASGRRKVLQLPFSATKPACLF